MGAWDLSPVRRRAMALVQSVGEMGTGWRGRGLGLGWRQIRFAWVGGRRERMVVRMVRVVVVVGRCMVKGWKGIWRVWWWRRRWLDRGDSLYMAVRIGRCG